MKNVLLLDLEETLIPIWDNWTPINVEKIKSVIRDENIDTLATFSWAIWNDDDIRTFKENKAHLEEAIGKEFDMTFSIQHFKSQLTTRTGVSFFDDRDFFDHYRKEDVLFRLALFNWMPGCNLVLLDDVVKEANIQTGGRDIKIINIWDMDYV